MAKHYLHALKGKGAFLFLLALGVLFLLIGAFSGGGGESAAEDVDSAAYFAEAEAYRTALEGRIGTLCDAVGGVSDVLVLVTLESGEVGVYLDSKGTGSQTVVARKPPPVAGVAIVCKGGDDVRIRQTLIELVAAALSLGTHRVSVSGR